MTVWAIALGGFSWTFAEYALHAWVGHQAPGPFARSHRAHHRDSADGLSASVKLALVAAVLGPTSAVALLVGSSAALAFLAGLGAAFAAYDQLHARAHVHPPATVYGRWMRRHHLLHHRDPRVNFGVTTPLWDWAFGTLAVHTRIEVERARAPWWLVDDDGELRARFADDYVLVGGPRAEAPRSRRMDPSISTPRR